MTGLRDVLRPQSWWARCESTAHREASQAAHAFRHWSYESSQSGLMMDGSRTSDLPRAQPSGVDWPESDQRDPKALTRQVERRLAAWEVCN